MLYRSTRSGRDQVSSAKAIAKGLAPDGGLYVPMEFPRFSPPPEAGFAAWSRSVLGAFLTDFTDDELREATRAAYGAQFSGGKTAPLESYGAGVHVLELFHGPTLAFKDIALQLLPRLLPRAVKKSGQNLGTLILVATSGDTGKAALEGFKDVAGVRIVCFYPRDGVSPMQRRQMATQQGNNARVVAVEGNFDDTQSGVKRMFTDGEFSLDAAGRGWSLSSANSINFGRLAPQIAYYFYAYRQMLDQGAVQSGGKVNFIVPTGNFGNILAGYYAMRMGLPVGRLICASNRNNILTDFFSTGVYDTRRPFYRTTSPSMDILISSNLERLLFELCARDGKRVSEWMDALKTQGRYQVPGDVAARAREIFWAGCADDGQAARAIRQTFDKTRHPMDPHTATGWAVYQDYLQKTGDVGPCVLLSTASPFKFPGDVLKALGERPPEDEFMQAQRLSDLSGLPVPESIVRLKSAPVLHRRECAPDAMARAVLEFL